MTLRGWSAFAVYMAAFITGIEAGVYVSPWFNALTVAAVASLVAWCLVPRR